MSVTAPDVETLRRFNRTWTATAGLLQAGLLDSPWSLTEARVIFELAPVERTDVADLRRALALDSGYLTRIVARLRTEGVVSTEPSPADGRRQVVGLTARGRAEFAQLDQRSVGQVHALLGALDSPTRTAVVAAMATLTTAFAPDAAASDRALSVVLRGPAPGDVGWIVSAHGELYAREWGYDRSFEGLVAQIVADHVTAADPESERTWIATLDGRRVGCIACVRGEAADEARLRILLVDPSARGHGVGTRLVEACVGFAREAGYRRMVLFTVDALVAARRLYEAAGFTLRSEEPAHEWGVDVTEQTWALDL